MKSQINLIININSSKLFTNPKIIKVLLRSSQSPTK